MALDNQPTLRVSTTREKLRTLNLGSELCVSSGNIIGDVTPRAGLAITVTHGEDSCEAVIDRPNDNGGWILKAVETAI